MAIPKIYKYGIEITKPWSSEMYEFNDNLRAYYKDLIIELIDSLETPDECHVVASIVNPYGYGLGLASDVEYMKEDMTNNVQNAENYWILEIVEELDNVKLISMMRFKSTPEMPAISLYDLDEKMNIIGFESREEILELRERYKEN